MKNKYCFCELMNNIIAFLITKLFYRPARLIRRPLYLRGRRSIKIGRGMTTGHSCRFDLDGQKRTLYVGNNCEFGDYTHIVALNKVVIGNNVLVASKVFISDTSHGEYGGLNQDSPDSKPKDRKLVKKQVNIGNNVWIGENVVILPGSTIGNGCIIGANSVVNGKKFEDNTIIVGSPARIVKRWNDSLQKWEKEKNG